MTEPTKQLTVSISVPAVLHLVIGAVLVATATAAYIVHVELPTSSPYLGDALTASVILSIIAASYWLWCSIQVSRSETADLRELIVEASATAKRRDEAVLAALGEIAPTLATIAGEVAENAGRLKELADALDESTAGLIQVGQALTDSSTRTAAAVEKATRAVTALQDCYLKEGRLLLFPEPLDAEQLRDVDPALAARRKARTN